MDKKKKDGLCLVANQQKSEIKSAALDVQYLCVSVCVCESRILNVQY